MHSSKSRARAFACALILGAGSAAAQQYPAKPVTIVVPFAPGGGSDNIARVIATKLSENFGKQFIVENRAGAGTNIGNEAAAKAAPNGYTLLLGQVTLGINPSLYPKLGYDVQRDLVPVGMVATSPTVLVVNPSLPAKNLQELIALAKAKPGTLNFGSGGNGTSVHLAGELFKSIAGTDIVHVAYKGSSPAVTDLMGGQIQMMFDTAPSATPHIKAGRLRAIAVTGDKRLPELPNVPTFAESGLKGFDATAWYGIMAPANTPKDVIANLNAAVNKVLADPGVRKRLQEMGAEPAGGTPEQLGDYLRQELAKWGKVIRDAKIKLD
jgi:tripartite-type tricarboxylate transporter receptor subunit TctC